LSEVVLVIPYFDLSFIGGSNEIGLGWVYDDGANEVIVGLVLFHFLHGIVVEHPDVEIIRPTDYPLFLGDEPDCSDGVD
jgi:hypothetical protein